MPGPGSAVDTRPRGLREGSQEELSLGSPPSGTRGRGRVCGGGSAAAPSTGVQGRCWARRGAGVPSQAWGPQLRVWLCPVEGWVLPLWASGRVGCSQDVCLLASSLGGLTCPGLVSALLSPILALGPVLGHAGPRPPTPCSFSLLPRHRQQNHPPLRPLALPGGTDALLLTSTYTLPPPRARSAACLSCTFQQSPGALKRPLRSYPEGGGEGGWGPGRGAGLERPPCCVCAGRGGMRGGS